MYQIFVVEDELLIRQNIRDMVENMEGPYSFCGEASDGEMALSMMTDLMPDILLTDIKMPFLDGFELIRHAKTMMPWLKTAIISGYDEFESAQKAISLGVDLYLLKPVRPTELAEAIHKMALQLEQSRSRGALPTGYSKDEVKFALYQHFMQQMLFGGADTGPILERAASLGLEIVHPFYQVILFHFESADSLSIHWQQKIAKILLNRHPALYYFDGTDQLALLAYAKNVDSLNEAAYLLVKIIYHELKDDDILITTLVGNIVQRVSLVKDAYNASNTMLKKLQAVSVGQVIDINDMAQITTDIVGFSSSFGERFGQRLLYASPEDIPNLMSEFWDGTDSDQYNSMLYRYYTLVDILKTAVQIVSAAKPDVDKKDIAAQLSSAYDIFAASSRRDFCEKQAQELLMEAIRMKQENRKLVKHSHVISQAAAYISKQYCDPNISLISVARHVGMSSAHFSTIFSQTFGNTFISHLTTLRIKRAKELLSQTDMKLAAIAMEIGYNEPNYFSHVFKKNEGITPKEYRNNFQDQYSFEGTARPMTR
ncbi:helix-turn-helix domain-containing protein [Oscillospiraceae bacterium MB08-C2-2]|nr:helix-turn-helix domain-containing protein [Oscillospiraceae bacterium MB08-C2-2]